MQIRVLLFASLREAVGAHDLWLDLPLGSSAIAVAAELSRRCPQAAGLLQRSALAINEAYAAGDAPLHDGDLVAVIPPVSGGAESRQLGSRRSDKRPNARLYDVPHHP